VNSIFRLLGLECPEKFRFDVKVFSYARVPLSSAGATLASIYSKMGLLQRQHKPIEIETGLRFG
jgi:hypothetical protein